MSSKKYWFYYFKVSFSVDFIPLLTLMLLLMLYFNMLFYYILHEVMLFISLILFHSFDLFVLFIYTWA